MPRSQALHAPRHSAPPRDMMRGPQEIVRVSDTVIIEGRRFPSKIKDLCGGIQPATAAEASRILSRFMAEQDADRQAREQFRRQRDLARYAEAGATYQAELLARESL